MPPGGDGYYYFSTYLLGDDAEIGYFNMEINGNILCTVRVDQQETSGDTAQAACSSAIFAAQGNKKQYLTNTTSLPLKKHNDL